MQNGEKKQPDYIIVFRINGVIRNMEEAQKASRQFEIETGKVMPILIIDKDECWATEKRLAEKMKCINYSIKDYKECYENTTTEEREECINRIKSFYQMLVRLNSKEESGRDER